MDVRGSARPAGSLGSAAGATQRLPGGLVAAALAPGGLL